MQVLLAKGDNFLFFSYNNWHLMVDMWYQYKTFLFYELFFQVTLTIVLASLKRKNYQPGLYVLYKIKRRCMLKGLRKGKGLCGQINTGKYLWEKMVC